MTTRQTKAYEVILSTGNAIKIDQDELPKIMASIQSGSPAIVKQGLINPSFIVSVVPDQKRIKEWIHECNYSDGSGDRALKEGMKPLEAIMPKIEDLKLLNA